MFALFIGRQTLLVTSIGSAVFAWNALADQGGLKL